MSPKQVRIEALKLAIESDKSLSFTSTKTIVDRAVVFEDYINDRKVPENAHRS